MFEDLKVVVPLGVVPEGDTVTKKGGTNEYVVRKKIVLHNHEAGGRQEVTADAGCVFLAGDRGHVDAYGIGKEVVWHTSLETLNRLEDDADHRELIATCEEILEGKE